jgi:two-component system, NarL family, response regulator LiaR
VIVADDDPMARRLLRDTLQAAGIRVVASATDGRETVELALFYRPDIVLMDLVMPGCGGLDAMRRLAADAPDVKVVVLTSSSDDDLALMALRAGGSGLLDKGMALSALPGTLYAVHNGEAAVSRRLTARLVEEVRHMRTETAGLRPIKSPLTDREWEVLDLLCQERSTEQIAGVLFLSPETVRSHIKSMLRKLRVRSRAEAVAEAQFLRAGLMRRTPVAA